MLYNGQKQWQAANQLRQLIALPEQTPLWNYQPQIQYYLVDESRYPQGKNGSLSGLLFKLENAQSSAEVVVAINEIMQAAPRHLDSLRRALLVWMSHVVVPLKGLNIDQLATNNIDGENIMLATRFEQWEHEIRTQALQQGLHDGIEQGLAQGMQQGMQQGITQGEALLLVKMLTRKFGQLPDWVLQKISCASAEQIEQWADRFFDCATLEAVFSD